MTPFTTVGAIAALATVATLAACSADLPLPPDRDDPVLHLLVRPMDAADTTAADSGLFAALLTAGDVIQSSYRTAERFDIVREGDGRRLAWRHTGDTGPAPANFAALAAGAGNYFLPRSGGAELGWEDIRAGDSFTLHIETGGAVVTGRVHVPGTIAPALEWRGDEAMLTWPSVPDAGGYVVASDDRRVPGVQSEVLDETSVVLDSDLALGIVYADTLAVVAVDSGLATFMRSPRAERAGLDAGLGLFGAYTRAVVVVPRP